MDRKHLFSHSEKEAPARPQHAVWKYLFASILFAAICFGVIFTLLSRLDLPPENFPVNVAFTLPQGTHVREAAILLKEAGLVRSSAYAQLILITTFKDEFVQAGVYVFAEPFTATEIANAITSGSYLSPTYKATFPEGFRTDNILLYLPDTFKEFDVAALKKHEGYLFPDTYFFSDTADAGELVKLMQENFDAKIEPLKNDIDRSSFSLEEIITLASIIEREANDETSMRTVAGILINRLTDGMPLQVDATFEYLLGKTSEDLTQEDLELDSPYNTYLYKGLPPTPIANPGLVAISAVLNPIQSDYLYYLTGDDGNFYYARTFEEHKRNKELHLR